MAERHKFRPEDRFRTEPYPEEKQKKSVNFQASPGDMKIIDEISESLGVGRGEAIRTALRVYHAIRTRN